MASSELQMARAAAASAIDSDGLSELLRSAEDRAMRAKLLPVLAADPQFLEAKARRYAHTHILTTRVPGHRA